MKITLSFEVPVEQVDSFLEEHGFLKKEEDVPAPAPAPSAAITEPPAETTALHTPLRHQEEAVPTVTETPKPTMLDKDGIPWDARIHSAKPSFTAQGLWRQRRNTDPETMRRVYDELKAAVAAPAAPIVPPPPVSEGTAIDVTAQPSEVSGTASVTAPEVPLPPPTADSAEPSAPPPTTTREHKASGGVAVTVSPSEMTFPQLMMYITQNGIPLDKVRASLMAAGLESVLQLQHRPDLVPVVAQGIVK